MRRKKILYALVLAVGLSAHAKVRHLGSVQDVEGGTFDDERPALVWGRYEVEDGSFRRALTMAWVRNAGGNDRKLFGLSLGRDNVEQALVKSTQWKQVENVASLKNMCAHFGSSKLEQRNCYASGAEFSPDGRNLLVQMGMSVLMYFGDLTTIEKLGLDNLVEKTFRDDIGVGLSSPTFVDNYTIGYRRLKNPQENQPVFHLKTMPATPQSMMEVPAKALPDSVYRLSWTAPRPLMVKQDSTSTAMYVGPLSESSHAGQVEKWKTVKWSLAIEEPGMSTYAAVSPAGTHLAYYSTTEQSGMDNAERPMDLMVVNLGTSEVQKVATDVWPERTGPNWTGDGAFLVYRDTHYRLWASQLDTGKREELLAGKAYSAYELCSLNATHGRAKVDFTDPAMGNVVLVSLSMPNGAPKRLHLFTVTAQ